MEKLAATRDAYGEALRSLGEDNQDIVVLDADLSQSTKTSIFAKAFPDRFFNVGIAECDMMGIAAGLAHSGKVVFASTFAVFATGRVYDQIRQSIAYPNINVKIVASHAGVTVGADGASHQALEDIALMRVLPNMTVIVPSDARETRDAVRLAASWPGPVYVRLGRESVPIVMPDGIHFEIGKGTPLYPAISRDRLLTKDQGQRFDVLMVACGVMVKACLEAAAGLEKEGLNCLVLDFASIKPLDEELLLACAKMSKVVVTAEEHSIIGGLGSAVCECLADAHPSVVRRVGVRDVFGQSGTAAELLRAYGLMAEDVATAAKRALGLLPATHDCL
ncbi:MAG: transketolase family protein [Bacillota bacterium]